MQAEMPLVTLLRFRLPRGGLFSGRTAAWLHGIDVAPCNPIEVTLPRLSQTSRIAGAALTRSDVRGSDVAKAHELPVTSATRTLADLARRLPLVDAVVVLDMALHSRLVSTEQMVQWADSHAGYRGIGRLKRAVELAEPAAESPMETKLRMMLVTAGLPRPRAQVSLYDETGIFIARPDLCYSAQRLVLEYDGATHRNSLVADNRRQNRLQDAGYRVLRFTASDILERQASVVALVRRAHSIGSPN
jgi:very-short-patch-repair endonuclease